MPTITGIKPQKSKKRVNIYLDDKFGFGLDLENFIKLGLKVEQVLAEEEVSEIVKKSEFQKTLDYLLRFATLRSRSAKEITDWFKRKRVHESMHKGLFDRLKHLELLDDTKFAKWWISQRQNFRPKAKRILNYELRIKGISEETIREVLSEMEIDEKSIAVELLKKKDRGWDSQKMLRYLAAHGFDWEKASDSVKIYSQWRNKMK
ncbi:MAG: RecX family transcriptional regulator [Patescibacteria group bacterium]